MLGVDRVFHETMYLGIDFAILLTLYVVFIVFVVLFTLVGSFSSYALQNLLPYHGLIVIIRACSVSLDALRIKWSLSLP